MVASFAFALAALLVLAVGTVPMTACAILAVLAAFALPALASATLSATIASVLSKRLVGRALATAPSLVTSLRNMRLRRIRRSGMLGFGPGAARGLGRPFGTRRRDICVLVL